MTRIPALMIDCFVFATKDILQITKPYGGMGKKPGKYGTQIWMSLRNYSSP